MELVTTPSPKGDSQDHLEQLALHEFRHVVQVDKLRQGFTRGLSYVIGEAGTGGVAGFMPFWFLEGDATDAETRLSYAGRGRLPSFEMEIKAILADVPGLYSYEKAVFGSFRDYVPDHYQYGYQMVSHGRNKYGNGLWENMVTFTGRKPFSLYPFYFGLKKYAGISKTGLYTETFETLRSHWGSKAAERVLSETIPVNKKKKKHYTSYRFPLYMNDTLVFAEKTGIDQIPEFVSIDQRGQEKRIHRPGFYDAANISMAGNRIVWTEIMWDPRWERRSYSVIKIYDVYTGTERILRLRTRYFSPDISSDGKFITAVETDEQNRYFLVILRQSDGEVLERVNIPGNEYPQFPVWNEERNRIYMSTLGDKGKKIKYYSVDTGEWGTVFDAGFTDIAELDSKGDYLIFRGGFSGIDNIYAINLESAACQMITSSSMGAFTPSLSANGDTLLYADYSSQGYNVVKTVFDPSGFMPLEFPDGNRAGPAEQLNLPSVEEISRVLQPGNPSTSYETTKYRKSGNLFNFHSWAPFYVDPDDPSIEDLQVSPGLMLLSQNLLSTATTILGYEYNLLEREHYFHSSFTYSGWYPELKLTVDYGGMPAVLEPSDTSLELTTVRTDLSGRLKMSLPLNLTYNRYVMGAIPSAEASYSRSYFYYYDQGDYRSGMTFMDYRLYYYTYLRQAKRDILPRLGFLLDLRYVDTPFEDEQLGSQIYGSGTLYLPGPLRHQTLRLYAGAQKQDTKRYLMGNLLSMPRGLPNYTAIRLNKFTIDYVFPLAYPDWQVWRAAYFKRFRGRIFYDYAYGEGVYINGNNGPVNRSFESLGIELSTDMHLAQIFVPFQVGGRLIWIPETTDIAAEFVFSVNLSQLY
jgi:hypothetical protein